LKNIIRNFIREPLVHFLLLGAFIYLFYSLNAVDKNAPVQNQKQEISLGKNEINELKRSYASEFHQKPDASILSALIKKALEKKILLQEAYGLELYKNDTKIDNILLKKMHFILNSTASQTQPDESELKAYYTQHIKDYSQRKNISFYLIHFDSLSKKAQKDFYELLQKSSNFSAYKEIKKQTKEQIRSRFGNYFTTTIFQAKKEKWLPALPSKKGLEFVYLVDYDTLEPYPFEEVQERVLQDFQTQRRAKSRQKTLKQMQNSYAIRVQK